MADERTYMKLHIIWRVKRLRCIATGCTCAPDYPACWYCGAPNYPYPDMHRFIEYPGRMGWWLAIKRRAKAAIHAVRPKTCEMCNKRFYRGYGDGHCCSDECFTKWLPF